MEPPQRSSNAQGLSEFVTHVDNLLRHEHDEPYCGIVYADSIKQPSFIINPATKYIHSGL
jgi:hypothetical protein